MTKFLLRLFGLPIPRNEVIRDRGQFVLLAQRLQARQVDATQISDDRPCKAVGDKRPCGQ